VGGRGGQMEAGRNSYVTRRGFVTVHGDRDARRRPRRFRHRHHSCCHRPSLPCRLRCCRRRSSFTLRLACVSRLSHSCGRLVVRRRLRLLALPRASSRNSRQIRSRIDLLSRRGSAIPLGLSGMLRHPRASLPPPWHDLAVEDPRKDLWMG